MRSLIIRLTATVAFFGLAGSLHSQTKHFVIVHSNDTHGHLIPYSLPAHYPDTDRTASMPSRQNIGGVARRATLINKIRHANPYVYCFDAGDNMDGTLFSTEYHDRADYAAINAMRYDYCVTGNHEYSLRADSLRNIIRKLRPKLVLANVRDRATHEFLGREYTIDDWDGVKVAVVGLVTAETRGYPAAREAFDIEDPIEVAKRLVPQLRKKADLVVLVTHVGLTVDQQIAAEVPGVDVIVGGHSHTRLPHGIYQSAKNPGASDPRGTIIVQTGSYGAELGKLDLDVRKDENGWHVINYADSLILLTANIPEDPLLKRVVDQYWQPIYVKYHDTLAVAAADFTDYQDEASTNYYLVADACQGYGKCQFSLQNVGGVRAPLIAGPVTRYDLVSMIPFVDTLAVATIKGSELDSVISQTFAQPSAQFHYVIHHSKPNGREQSESWRVAELTLDGHPIQPDSIYTFSAADFFINSVRQHLISVRNLDRTTIDVLSDYVHQKQLLNPTSDDRIRVLEE
jgi:5'-nucleotidase/UDP-sugar diphosphatase